jgi:hypothetical protein
MKTDRTATVEEVLLGFAEAELDQCLDPASAMFLLSKSAATWTLEERRAALMGLGGRRGVMLVPLLALEPKWSEATLPTGEVPSLRSTEGPWFAGLAPNWTLAEFVDSFARGKDSPDPGLKGKVRRLADTFDVAQLRGRPILVGDPGGGPLTVLEGTKRFLAIATRLNEGKPIPDPIPVYVGLTPQIGDWGFARRK